MALAGCLLTYQYPVDQQKVSCDCKPKGVDVSHASIDVRPCSRISSSTNCFACAGLRSASFFVMSTSSFFVLSFGSCFITFMPSAGSEIFGATVGGLVAMSMLRFVRLGIVGECFERSEEPLHTIHALQIPFLMPVKRLCLPFPHRACEPHPSRLRPPTRTT